MATDADKIAAMDALESLLSPDELQHVRLDWLPRSKQWCAELCGITQSGGESYGDTLPAAILALAARNRSDQ